jgi:NADH:ubiquinone oxidoreductase subunit 4 (subunit M)
LLLSGIFIFNPCVTFICSLGLFACAAFTLKLYGLMFYGKFGN